MPAQKFEIGRGYTDASGNERVWDGAGMVTPEAYVAKKEAARLKAAGGNRDLFNQAQILLQNLDKVERRVDSWDPAKYSVEAAGYDSGQVKRPGFQNWILPPEGKAGTLGYQINADLAPIRNAAVEGVLGKFRAMSPNGGGVQMMNSEKESDRAEGAYGSLLVGQDPADLKQSLQNIRKVATGWTPGLSRDNPIDLNSGVSRADLPEGAIYRSPDGAPRRNINVGQPNKILYTPANDPQKPYKDAKLAWNDRWYDAKGNLDGADAAFEKWWSTTTAPNVVAARGGKKAPPIAPPPGAKGGKFTSSNF